MSIVYCTRRWLEARCRAAGVTLERCAECIVAEEGDMVRADQAHANFPRLGLGDMVATGLEAIGVTKERVSEALGRPCNCKRRQESLNRLGERLGMPPGSTASVENPR